MMFSRCFTIVLLIVFGVKSQTYDINTLRSNNIVKGYPFGKLRLSETGKNEELIAAVDTATPQLNQEQVLGVQPLPSPCIGTRPATKLAYPKDKTKYIECRDEFHYEFFTCPNGGEFNEQTNACDRTAPIIDKCEQEKPCLNDGQCISLTNSTFKCVCRPDWTGERCETVLNSCVRKPCGPSADCHTLKTVDYEQDYVCVCHASKSYGLTCQDTVPNPCLTSTDQYFPYAFSQHAYVQCDADLIYFQPCGPLLYWNQEEKICDRKRSTKNELPPMLKKKKINKYDKQQDKNIKSIIEEIITTTVLTEVQIQPEGNTGYGDVVPAKTINRQPVQSNTNNLQDQLPSSINTNQNAQDYISQTKQWPNEQTGANMKQTPTVQPGRNQLWSFNLAQQQWIQTSTESTFINSNIGQSQLKQNNQQQQNLPQQNQAFGSAQWLNHIPDSKPQNNQNFVPQSQSWQTSQLNQNQQTLLETTTPQSLIRLQGYQNQNVREQEQSWQNRPTNNQLTGNQLSQNTAMNTQNLPTPTQSWQRSETIQHQPRFEAEIVPTFPIKLQNLIQLNIVGQIQQTLLETTTPQSLIRLQGYQNQNVREQEQSWQNRPTNNQLTGNQLSQKTAMNTQNLPTPTQSWQRSETIQHQPRFEAEIVPTSFPIKLQNLIQLNIVGQNQQTLLETTTPQSLIRLQGYQNQNVREQEQSWQNRPTNNQLTGNQLSQNTGINTQNLPTPTQSWQTSQSYSTQQLPSNNQEKPFIDNKNNLNTGMQQHIQHRNEQPTIQNQASWQQRGNNPIRQGFTQPEGSSVDTQRLPLNNEQLSVSQPTQNQHWTSTFQSGSSTDLNNGQAQKVMQPQIKQDNLQQQQQNLQQQNYAFGLQSKHGVASDIKTPTNQHHFGGYPQTWQGSQHTQTQPLVQNQNSQPFIETTTGQNLIRLQGFPNSNSQDQDQSWQNKLPTTLIQNQPVKTHTNQNYGSTGTQWPVDTSKQNLPDTIRTQNFNQQPLVADTTSQIQNTQFGLNQQQKNLPIQNTHEQKPSWSNHQQFQTQGNQLIDSDNMKMQTNQDFHSRPVTSSLNQPWSHAGQINRNTLETPTNANKGSSIGASREWQTSRTQDTLPIGQQTLPEQRKPSDTLSSILSGSWKSRS